MEYLFHKDGNYYFNRRVPKIFKAYDSRKIIRTSLKTDCKRDAIKRVIIQNEELENYWKQLAETGQTYCHRDYQATVQKANALGFSYFQSNQLALASIQQLLERLLHIEKHNYSENHVEAILGGVAPPEIKISEALAKFWDIARNQLLNKSPNQIRKWKNPRKLAIKNFIRCIGDKNIKDITREDTLKFRDWWIRRIEDEDLVTNTANKNFTHVKAVIETISDNFKLKIEIEYLFKKLHLEEDDARRRLPFETSFITSELLNPLRLEGLNDQAKHVLYVIAETGVGLTEQVNLLPEDIVLDAEIPYISIVPRKKKGLKTKYRTRKIPLVGYALEAFKAFPNGFTDYKDKPDALSAVLGKYLRENKLLPTEQHTVYSLRHSFQDRLLAANTLDRIQADLMGHKFHRPAYGDGTSIEQKFEWLKKIQLKKDA